MADMIDLIEVLEEQATYLRDKLTKLKKAYQAESKDSLRYQSLKQSYETASGTLKDVELDLLNELNNRYKVKKNNIDILIEVLHQEIKVFEKEIDHLRYKLSIASRGTLNEQIVQSNLDYVTSEYKRKESMLEYYKDLKERNKMKKEDKIWD